jgi:hypothetical protein
MKPPNDRDKRQIVLFWHTAIFSNDEHAKVKGWTYLFCGARFGALNLSD